MTLAPALAQLAQYRQFIICKLVPLPTGKTDKIPCCPRTGVTHINAHDPRYHVSADEAFEACRLNADYRVAFVLTANDPMFCLDVDGCLQSDGTWSPLFYDAIQRLPGAAVEVSASGTGGHIWGTYRSMPPHRSKPPRSIRTTLTGGAVELYHEGRFICLGLPGATGNASTDCTAALPSVVAAWFPPGPDAEDTGATDDWADQADPEWRGPSDDFELVRRMLAAKPSAKAAFGSGASPSDLWTANEEVLARAYPSASGDTYDRSAADSALACTLGFWTGKNPVRTERLMRLSALYREKWDRGDGEEYLRIRTIPGAFALVQQVYRERTLDALTPAASGSDAPADQPRPAASRMVDGHTLCWPDNQVKMWDGCVYITEENRILTANGEMLDEARFKAKFGGLTYVLDAGNEKRTSNAWEAFVHSQAVRHPKVDRGEFRPNLPPYSIYHEGRLDYLNTYVPVAVPRKAGDATPFLNHLATIIPNPKDREIVLYYMAALVQYQGHKFNWALFIQGTHGNGKSLLSLCVQAAIGKVYCHMPRADGLTVEFNDWMVRTIFCGVEDVYLPSGRTEVLEILKPMITLEWQPIRAMRVSQTMKRVCVNFILNSNHKDGIRKTEEDRRFAPIFCAQQERGDLVRDGLTAGYFAQLYGWLEREGYAIVAEMLHTMVIPEEYSLPYLKGNAPRTSSTDEAVSLSLGPVELEVLEAVESCRRGFCGGWVASTELDALLREKRMDRLVPRNKRADMMKRIGYVWHPHLHKGRTNSPLTAGGKAVLYIKKGHIVGNLSSAPAILKAYEDAQVGAAAVGMGMFGRGG